MAVPSSSIEIQDSKAKSAGAWNQAVLLLLIVTLTYFQTWVDLWPYWNGTTSQYTHGVPIVLTAVWLLWRGRPAVNEIEPTPSMRMVTILVSISLLWLLAERANLFILYATLWPILAFLTLWVALGLRAALLFVSPLGFLYFAFPVWDILQPPLQTVASTMVGLLTKLIGMPAILDGNYITLPTGKLFIAEGCSGAQFLCISLAFGTLACILRGDVRGTRIVVLVIAGLLSMVFNWLRILVIAFVHLHPDMQGAMDWLGGHLVVGWWIFSVGLLLFGLILRFIPRTPFEPVTRELASRSTKKQSGNRAGLWLATFAVVTLPAIAWALPRFDSYPTERPAIRAELQRAGVEFIAPDLRWSPHYPGADWEERMAFVSGEGFVIEVYANQYHEQSQGSELISYISNLFDTSTFSPGSSHFINLRDLGGRPLPARRDILTDSSGRLWLTMYTYLVDKDPIANGRRVQLATAIRAMYSRAPAGIIAVAVPCVETCEPRFSVVEPVFIRLLEDYHGTLYE